MSRMTRQRDPKVELARVAHPSNIQTNLWASIDEKGLVIEGQDLGSGVEAIWGDIDYEYWLVVAPEHLDRVLEQLARELDRSIQIPDDPPERNFVLLDLVKRAWGRGRFATDVDFRQWLDSVDIPSSFSSYV